MRQNKKGKLKRGNKNVGVDPQQYILDAYSGKQATKAWLEINEFTDAITIRACNVFGKEEVYHTNSSDLGYLLTAICGIAFPRKLSPADVLIFEEQLSLMGVYMRHGISHIDQLAMLMAKIVKNGDESNIKLSASNRAYLSILGGILDTRDRNVPQIVLDLSVGSVCWSRNRSKYKNSEECESYLNSLCFQLGKSILSLNSCRTAAAS